ncbi:S41 family peptidase [Bacteroides eggerthii]|uniref:S41 family peptidase n=1 Tax=Bacteroides eggerthii TaxID=28111 RepID=A0ABT7U8I7_9BACE|nr:S41 family peptidase [Bacteroides eggerthii]
MSRNRSPRLMPLFLALSLVAGILIGTFYANHFSGNRLSIINTGSNKLNDLLRIIDEQYVDTVNVKDLVESAMPKILSELDPHSAYISAQNAEESMEDLKGSFSGIGVMFVIREDTIHIMNVVKGGPSEKVGLMAGDRIVSVDGKPFVGKEVTDVTAKKTLKGPKGSKVKLGIKRNHEKETLYFDIVRGDIPQHSIDASYMVTPDVGYIKVRSFSETTYPEMLVALAQLNREGFKNLIIDLRGNQGGYMHTAIQMANVFLPKDQLIVYTEGRKSPRENYFSDGQGSFRDIPLVVLVDEGSASASEIFAGAIQDNDRGLVIGRRSFGKGLVQLPIEFKDGSIIRLTTARYYTPSGRCIQKPYEKGHGQEYENDLLMRYERGEFFSQDSIKQGGEKYKTRLGRTVYGGGGIMPDIFVPEDTTDVTLYYKEAVLSGLVRQFCFNYSDQHREEINKLETNSGIVKFLEKKNVIDQFATYASQKGLRRRNLMIRKSRKRFEETIYGTIIYNCRDMEAYIEYLNESDPTIMKSLEVFENGDAKPKAPAQKTNTQKNKKKK